MNSLPIAYHAVLAGLLATSFQLLVGEWVAMLITGSRSPLAAIGKAMILLAPGPLVDVTVALVENFDKPIIRALVIGLFLGVGVLIGVLGLQDTWVAYGLLLLLGFASVAARALDSSGSKWPSLVAIVAGTCSGIIVWFLLVTYPFVYSLVGAGILAAALLWNIRRTKARRKKQPSMIRLPKAAQPLPPVPANCKFKIKGISRFMTPGNKFYVADTAFPSPAIAPEDWRLRIFGLVKDPFELFWKEILKMPLVELDATLICVHNPVGGQRIGNARWLGLPLASLLEKAGIQPEAAQVVARSEDGFSVSIPLYLLEKPWQVLVAIGVNRKALSHVHGFPARLIVPGIYGFSANIKWLTSLEIAPLGPHTFWEKRGWAGHPALVQPQCRIDTPVDEGTILYKRTQIAGTAWAPPFGVQRVEVAIDDGPWQASEMAEELSPLSWRQWRFRWHPTPGPHTIKVRTAGHQGAQVETVAPPFPDGATGLHTIEVTVLPPFLKLSKETIGQNPQHFLNRGKKRILLALAGIKAWRKKT